MCIYLLFFQGKSFCSNPREILPKESEPKSPSRLPLPTFNHLPKEKELNLLQMNLPNLLKICQNLASPKKNLPKPEEPPSPVRRSPSCKPPQLNYTKRPKSRYEFGLFLAIFDYNLVEQNSANIVLIVNKLRALHELFPIFSLGY